MGGVIPGAIPGLMRLGLSSLGSVNTYWWSGRLALPPPGKPQHPSTEKSYDLRIAGRIVQEPLTAARGFLKTEAGV